jgi:hypothetical protein
VRSNRQPYKGHIGSGGPERGLNERESEQRSSSGIDYSENPWFSGGEELLVLNTVFASHTRGLRGPNWATGGTKCSGRNTRLLSELGLDSLVISVPLTRSLMQPS